MVSYIKSKVQKSLSFLLMLVVAFSAFSGVLFLNPSPSYAFNQSDVDRALSGGANLSGADLSGARLSRATLIKARLIKANLIKADLRVTNLSGARLYGADLRVTNLSGARLYGARLSGASTNSETKFPDGFDAEGAGVEFFNAVDEGVEFD